MAELVDQQETMATYGDPLRAKRDPLLAKLEDLRLTFANAHRNWDDDRKYYNLAYEADVVPDTWRDRLSPLIPPTARRAVDEAVDHILYAPHIKVPVRPTTSRTVTERQIAEAKRSFLNAYWSQVTQRYNPLGDGRKPLLREGRICIKHTLRWDLIPEAGEMSATKYRAVLEKLGRYDFMWKDELLDNKTVFEDPTNHRDPMYVYITYEVYVEHAKAMFPEIRGSWTRKRDYEKCKYTEYWSKPTYNSDGSWEPGDYIQWIDQEQVNKEDNCYPYVPIAIEDAGYGDVYDGVEPDKKYVGISHHFHSMFIAEAKQMTSWEAVTELSAFPVGKHRNGDNTRHFEVGPGEIWDLEGASNDPNAEDFEFLQMPDIPQGVIKLVEKTTDYANGTLKMDALGGMPAPGVDTATEADQNIRNAAAKLQAPIAALERLATKISKWVLMDIEQVLKVPVSVYGTSDSDPTVAKLAPKEIAGYYETRVEFQTTDEDAVSENKARFWLEAYMRSPFLSAMTAMERGDIAEDPLQEMVKRMAEDVVLSPQMQQIRMMAAAQAYGELSQMLQQLQAGPPTDQGGSSGGVNDANAMAPVQPPINPATAAIMGGAYGNRDVNQGGSQFNAAPR